MSVNVSSKGGVRGGEGGGREDGECEYQCECHTDILSEVEQCRKRVCSSTNVEKECVGPLVQRVLRCCSGTELERAHCALAVGVGVGAKADDS